MRSCVETDLTMGRKLRFLASVLTAVLLLAGAVLPAAAAGTGGTETVYAGLSARELAVRAAAEGTVLLKNDGTLPLKKGTKVAVFGTNTDANFYAGGGGSGGSNTTDIMTYAKAFRQAESAGDLSLYAPLTDYYAGRTSGEVPPADLLDGAAAFTDTADLESSAPILLSRFSQMENTKPGNSKTT